MISSHSDYEKANKALRRGAWLSLIGPLMGTLLLVWIAWFIGPVMVPGDEPMAWFFWPWLLGLFVFGMWMGRRNYRGLAGLRVTDAGLERGDGTGRVTVPWHALQDIEWDGLGIRIRAPGYSEVLINLRGIGNQQALLDVISVKRPTAARLTMVRGWRALLRG